ncbi:hypothetical protein LTR62_004539 [Meristemomyces frigidus]|uniref:SH3 domain-containing protein n=1 Tax=Meristemomyces frigidus TaxID=1508187 RepID=A0AAN7TQN1_9PEZI|nr:hypothetical protein LTR62_004539 [Meristemomyces frigidus]
MSSFGADQNFNTMSNQPSTQPTATQPAATQQSTTTQGPINWSTFPNTRPTTIAACYPPMSSDALSTVLLPAGTGSRRARTPLVIRTDVADTLPPVSISPVGEWSAGFVGSLENVNGMRSNTIRRKPVGGTPAVIKAEPTTSQPVTEANPTSSKSSNPVQSPLAASEPTNSAMTRSNAVRKPVTPRARASATLATPPSSPVTAPSTSASPESLPSSTTTPGSSSGESNLIFHPHPHPLRSNPVPQTPTRSGAVRKATNPRLGASTTSSPCESKSSTPRYHSHPLPSHIASVPAPAPRATTPPSTTTAPTHHDTSMMAAFATAKFPYTIVAIAASAGNPAENQLGFHQGQVMVVSSTSTPWYHACDIHGNTGLVPSPYVRVLSEMTLRQPRNGIGGGLHVVDM